MKVLKKALVALLGAVLGCCFFVGCLSTKLSVTYVVDGETYRVQEYEMDTQIALPKDPTKEGYTFIGWYTDEALTVPYAEGTVTAGLTLYAKFSISTVFIVINTAGGAKLDPVEVVPGGDYTLPEAEKEGHTFLGYYYVDENGDEQEFPLTGKYPGNGGIKITAKYAVNKYTVTFVGASNSEQEVAYGSVAIAPNADKAGYNFDGWYTSETEQTDATKFDMTTAITGDITLYAKYTAKSFTITVNGAQVGYENPTVVFGEEYTLTAPVRENREFVGFTMNGQDFPATGVYTWTTDIAVDAVWDGVGKDVMFFDGENEMTDIRIDTETGVEMSSLRLPAVPAKDGHSTDGKWYTDKECTTEFVANGTVETDIRLYAKYTANEYTVNFVVWDKATKTTKIVPVTVIYGQVMEVPAKADRDAYNFDGYFYNDEWFDTSKAYTLTTGIILEEKWTLKDDASLFENKGQYFMERDNYDADWTYVYLVDSTYTLSSATDLSIVTAGGDQYATVNGNKLTINAAGSFEIQLNKVDGTVEFRTIKALKAIKSLDVGSTGYDESWGLTEDGSDYKRNTKDIWQKQVLPTAGEVMLVGAKHFIPEVSIDGSVKTFDSASVNVTMTVDGAETKDFAVANGAIDFGASLVGKTVTVTLAPKYNVYNQQAVYTVKVNNATNVYNNDEMKAAFADTNVTEINVLRNIEAALYDNQVNTFTVGGYTAKSPINYEYLEGDTTGYSTGVYVRRSGDLKINGNYFTVDGSKLPLVDMRDPNLVTPHNGGYNKPGTGYAIADTRFSIFLFGRRNWPAAGTYQIDNLNVYGNGDMDAGVYYEIESGSLKALKYSGAAICLQVNGGNMTMNNVTARYGSFAILMFSNAQLPEHQVFINAVDCKFDKSWANNLYANGFADITFDNCYVGQANGASIHWDVQASAYTEDSALHLKGDTVVENWVTGQEAWFTGQGATAAIGLIKEMLNPNLANFGKTVVKKEGNAEKVNFAIIMRMGGSTSDWTGDGNPELADKHGSQWMQDVGADANYIGYLNGKGFELGLGALNVDASTFDIEYAGFMQGAGYPAEMLGAYVQSHLGDRLVKARSNAMGFMEIYVGMINA